MTSTEMDTRGAQGMTPRVPQATRISQATAVEQSRAVAEVQAAIVVAQQCPRNVPLAIDMMRESCGRKELAERAFFSYKRGPGVIDGPSVHLARELARCWGNIQYGLREMRRDEEASEMLAFAWDVQTNARCDNIIINPHRRYTGGQELTDLRDVYENNANVGARRVREAIFAVLPAWYVEEAISLCNKTLIEGDGKPLAARIADALGAFAAMGVTVAQLETRFGASAKWLEPTVAQMRVTYRSITRGEITKDEAFPDAPVTAEDILAAPRQPQGNGTPADAPSGPSAPPAADRPPATRSSLGKALGRLPLGEPEDVGEFLTWRTGRQEANTLADLTKDEITAIDTYIAAVTESVGDPEAAAEAIWTEYRAASADTPA